VVVVLVIGVALLQPGHKFANNKTGNKNENAEARDRMLPEPD